MIATEKRFESDIEAAMLSGGYTRNNDTYDAKNAAFRASERHSRKVRSGFPECR